MSDRKAIPGKPLQFPAQAYNDMRDMLRWWKSSERGRRRSTKTKISDRHNQSRTLVANNTGGDLAMYDCAQIGPPQSGDNASDYVKERMLYASATPFESATDNVCVALEPIRAGELGLVAVSGICIAHVHMSNLSHRHAISSRFAEAELFSANSGGVRIISVFEDEVQSRSGVHKCLINLSASGDNLFPVIMEKISGDAGDVETKCNFTYNVYEMVGNDQGDRGDLLHSGVNPEVASGGIYQRTEIGRYVEATHGLAYFVSDSDRIEIAWCNEVFDVAECKTEDFDTLRFGGMYDESKSYNKNTLVHDGPYQMVSKQSTRERPAPQPTGEPRTKIGTVPTWAQVSGTGRETITGQRYTWASGGQLSKVRVYIPAPSGGGGGGGGGPGGGTP